MIITDKTHRTQASSMVFSANNHLIIGYYPIQNDRLHLHLRKTGIDSHFSFCFSVYIMLESFLCLRLVRRVRTPPYVSGKGKFHCMENWTLTKISKWKILMCITNNRKVVSKSCLKGSILWYNSLFVCHQNVPITSILTDFTLVSWKDFDVNFLLIGSKEMIWISSFGSAE